jgi:hypothetical protein
MITAVSDNSTPRALVTFCGTRSKLVPDGPFSQANESGVYGHSVLDAENAGSNIKGDTGVQSSNM